MMNKSCRLFEVKYFLFEAFFQKIIRNRKCGYLRFDLLGQIVFRRLLKSNLGDEKRFFLQGFLQSEMSTFTVLLLESIITGEGQFIPFSVYQSLDIATFIAAYGMFREKSRIYLLSSFKRRPRLRSFKVYSYKGLLLTSSFFFL